MKKNLFQQILITMLISCLVFTSCFSFAPQVFADTTDDAQQEEPVNPGEGEGTDPSDPSTDPEPPEIITGWHEGYYYDQQGNKVVNTIMEIDSVLYSFDAEGLSSPYSGNYVSGSYVYLYQNGQKVTGTIYSYNGLLYKDGVAFSGTNNGLLYSNGAAFTGTYNDLFYLNGIILTGLYNSKYYKNGKLYSGTAGGVLYKNGVAFTGTKNKKYYKNGKLHSGIYKSYYYKKGVKVTKYKNKVKKMNNGKFYYFKKDGKVHTKTGWKRIKGKRYYFKKGEALTGWQYIGKYKYYFHKKSATLCQDIIECHGNKWKNKKYHIKVNRKKNCVTLYAKDGKNGYIIPVKALACSVGLKDTPTIKGTYTLKKSRTYRWWKLGGPDMGGYCWGQYCTRISGSYLFHSVTYAEKNKRTLSVTAYNNLGRAASHGCVRLRVIDAKLIYDIVRKNDAKVTIYDSNDAGPFDKPKLKKISYGQKYDPSDPTI